MKKFFQFSTLFFSASIASLVLLSFRYVSPNNFNKVKFPYKQAGLNSKQAAAHLVSRFTFGATPNLIDEVNEQGLENWFLQQLEANLTDDSLQVKLQDYDALSMNNEAILKNFPRNPDVLKMAIADGSIKQDEVSKADKEAYRIALQEYMKKNGLRPEKELFRQFINQKILRAAYSNNQLKEVMTDFWFNHFNVSITKNQCAPFIPVYERDAIRKNSLGSFQEMLLATAKSPAMLTYLDNFSSAGLNENFENKVNNFAKRIERARKDTSEKGKQQLAKLFANNNKGLNENYAREVMELHTLGVDGGYIQQDVTEAARVLTGWTMYPISDYGQAGGMKKVIERFGDKLYDNGFVRDGDFLFAINRHDDKEKTVLGKKFTAGGGYQEGVDLLQMLAAHPSTAKFISRKLATRFVNDNPPASLVTKMAKTFTDTKGDIKKVLLTMVTAPEFWSKEALREKTKSPFELAISSVRALDADIILPFQLNEWITRMGQKVYFYQAPTGFPDKGQYWINTGALLNRMNFALALATKKISGIQFDLAALNHYKEPESAEKALEVYCKILMPQRDVTTTIKRLQPLLYENNLVNKVSNAVAKTNATSANDAMMETNDKAVKERKKQAEQTSFSYANFSNSTVLMQVVGIIIGSPEFQRR